MNEEIKRTTWHFLQWLVLLTVVNSYTCPEKNVAVGKTAVQSSLLARGSLTFPANLAIDGNRSTLSQTEPGYVQWWYADLITPQNIARIQITVCEDCDSKFYMGNDYLLFTGVTRTSLNLVASKIQTKTSSFSITLPTAHLVRFVEIQRYERSNAKYPLALAEVEVYREPFTPEQSSLLPFRPSFTSSWLKIKSSSNSSQISIKHNLNEWPIRVTTEVQVNSGSDTIVFNGNGLSLGTLTMVYNSAEVEIVLPGLDNVSTSFTGPVTAWTGPEITETTSHFQIRVKVWRQSDLPVPTFQTQWTPIYDIKNFIEINHTVRGYPDLVVVQLNFSIAGHVYYLEGRGSSTIMDSTDTTGTALFGFNSKTVRVWIQNEFQQAYHYIADNLGKGESLTPSVGFIRVIMWNFFPDPLFDIRISPETTDFSKPQQLPYDITIDDFTVSVEIEVVGEGNNTDYRFYGAGSSTNESITGRQHGGLIYALTSTSVLVWRPTTGYFVRIGEWWDTEQYSQTTNNVSIRFAFYRLYNAGDVMCDLNQESFPYYYGTDRVSVFKEEITTTCPNGMKLDSGNLNRACARHCLWDGFPAVCINVTCPTDSLEVSNANYSFSGNSMQDTIVYQCHIGYAYTSGNLTRICLYNGQWSGEQPVCEEVVCPLEGTNVASSNYNITGNKLFDTVVYNCAFGYNHTSGNLQRSCLENSQWSGEAPVCSVIPCLEDQLNTNNSNYVIEGVLPGNKVTFQCDKGYKLTSGDNVKICQLGGQWDGLGPTCTEIVCSAEDLVVSYAIYKMNGQRPGNNITYSCATGYHHTGGNLTRVCQEDGSWAGESPQCEEILCSNTNLDILYASYITTGQKPGDNITYVCTPGYQHSIGDLTRICQENGSWSGERPICNEIVCSMVENEVANATYTNTGYKIDDVSVYACHEGFRHISGNLTRTCQINGLWTGVPPECIEVTCSKDGLNVFNTTHSVTGYRPGDTALYHCDIGFFSSNINFTRTCQKNGTWNGDAPVCQEIECSVNNIDVANAKHVIRESKPGQHIDYVCDEGFTYTAGNLTRTCQNDGSWSGYAPECKAMTCPVDNLIASRSVYKLHGNKFGDNVTYTCDYGYRHTLGTKSRWCLGNETWSGELPTCTLIECPLMEVNTSSHVVNITGNRYMDKAIFRCPQDLRIGQGSVTRICQSDSTWSGSRLICQPCFCPCVHETEEEVAHQMKETAKQLIIRKSTLSRTLRKKTSARDERQSAKAIGCIGIFMLIIILAILVVPDLPSLHRDITRGIENFRLIFKASVVPVLCSSDKRSEYEHEKTFEARKPSSNLTEHDGIKGGSFD